MLRIDTVLVLTLVHVIVLSYVRARTAPTLTRHPQHLDRNEKLLKDEVRLRQISERIPAGRWGEPRDFAGPVVFLASAASQYVCGEVLVVDGVSFPSMFTSPFAIALPFASSPPSGV